MVTFLTPKSSTDTDGAIPRRTIMFQRERWRNEFHGQIVEEFRRQKRDLDLKQKDLVARLKHVNHEASVISRWLSAPSNWTLDAMFDLAIGMGVELQLVVSGPTSKPADRAKGGEELEGGITLSLRSLLGDVTAVQSEVADRDGSTTNCDRAWDKPVYQVESPTVGL